MESWKVDRGLPQNTVLSVLQTHDGYLWIGTRFGLARFDGVRFTVFDSSNTPELRKENCAVLAEDIEGNLWVGTDDGLLRRSKNRFQRFTTADGLCHDRIRSLAVSRDGGMWIGTDRGFCRFENGSFTNYAELTDAIDTRVQIFEDNTGVVWFNNRTGLYRLTPATGEVTFALPLTERPHFFHETPDGKLWFGHSGGLFRVGATNAERIGVDGDAASSQERARVDNVFRSRAGDLWLTLSRDRVLHLQRGAKFLAYTRPDGEPLKGVEAISEDREGNVWVGTRYDGLVRLQRRFVSMVTTRQGLGSENTWSVCEDSAGTIWAGTRDVAVNRIHGLRAMPYFISNDMVDIVSLLPDGPGLLWVGIKKLHPGSSLYQFRDGIFTDFNAQSGVQTRSVSALWKDRAGYLWVGTPDGLTRWREGELSRFTVNHGLPHNDVRAILEDKQGTLWFGTYGGGICHLRNGRFVSFDASAGLSSNFAWELHEDAEGVLWIGTRNGLNRFKNGKFFSFTTQHGLFDNLVNCVLEDDHGFFWISCNRGIYRVSRAELNEVADGKKRSLMHFSYGTAEGMASSETNGENQPAGCKSRDGRLWFPTIAGLAVIDPSRVPTNEMTPPVVIEQVIADDQLLYGNGLETASASLEPHVNLEAGRARVLRIQFTANSLAAPDKVQFKYRLRGYEEAWRGPGKERVAYYTNLKPGKYEFEVIACNNHFVWNLMPAMFSFTLAPHFYERISFYVACALIALTTAFGAHKFRIRIFGRLKELEKFHAIELERGRIAKDMHDDLGSSLTEISLMTELTTRNARDEEELRQQVQQIGKTTRGVLQSLDEIVWATNPRNDTLEGLATFLGNYAREFLKHANIACRLDIPDVLPPVPVSAEVRHNLYLAVKEGLTNVVKHAGATEVRLRAQWLIPMLEVSVEDNGAGVSSRPADAHSDGLRNIEQRLRTLKGSFRIEPLENGGTRLRLRIPVFIH